MDKDNKVLLGSVLIILLAIISINFDGITGAATFDSNTNLYISPNVVSPGDRIYITISAPGAGVNKKAEFYHLADNLKVGSIDICKSSGCSGDFGFSYVISTSWDSGIYGVRVYSYEINEFITGAFTVDRLA